MPNSRVSSTENLSNPNNDNSNSQTDMKIELLVNMIPKFDGHKNSFYDFIDNCDLAMSLAHTTLKNTLLTFIKSKIMGNARAQIRNREFDTWSELREHLMETYSEKRSHAQWQLELNLCRQEPKENVTSYAHKIENCLVRLTNSLDTNLSPTERSANVKLLRSQALTIFIMGLTKDLNIVVKSQKPQSLEEAISLAQAEEKEQQARREIDKQHTHHNSYNFQRHNNNTSWRSQQPPRFQPPRTLTPRPAFTHTMSHFKLMAPNPNFKQCRYCKHFGHTIEECRKRQYNNSKRYTTNETATKSENKPSTSNFSSKLNQTHDSKTKPYQKN